MALAEANQLIQTNSAALDLADLFRPSTFLNAIRQQTARQLGVSIDSLKLTSYWPHQSSQAPVYGSRYLPVRIAKLKLEGANFESGRLAPSQPESPSLIHLPDVTLVWTEQVGDKLTFDNNVPRKLDLEIFHNNQQSTENISLHF
ncbi:hypothetical protein AHF37_00022 [Paragonimus kellicotti]|nr:hypothetical protein AHF37_00022 [Paragonimus kellicotti]